MTPEDYEVVKNIEDLARRCGFKVGMIQRDEYPSGRRKWVFGVDKPGYLNWFDTAEEVKAFLSGFALGARK